MRSLFLLFLGVLDHLARALVRGHSDVQWFDIGTKSVYYIEKTEKVTWFHATWKCASMGLERSGQEGRLANIESKSETNLLKKYLSASPSDLWIGLSRRPGGSFAWTDEKYPVYTNWAVNQPSNYLDKEDCAELRATSWTWNDEGCNKEQLFICASDKVVPPDCGPKMKDWKLFNGNCYLLRSGYEDALDWMSAEQYCVDRKAHLVSVTNQKEDTFVVKELLDRPESLHSFWSGLKLVANESFSNWTDGSPTNYTRIDGTPVTDGCVSFNLLLGKWKIIPCSRKMGVICKTPYVPLNSNEHDCSGTSQAKVGRTSADDYPKTDVGSGSLMAGIAVDIVISLLVLSILVYFSVKRWLSLKSRPTEVKHTLLTEE